MWLGAGNLLVVKGIHWFENSIPVVFVFSMLQLHCYPLHTAIFALK